MKSKNNPRNQVRALNHGGNGALRQAQTLARPDTFIFPQNERNFSKQITFPKGRIWRGHRISAGQDSSCGRRAATAYEAMNKKAPIATE